MDNNTNWRERCTELGLDPQELKAVSSRYDMYQRYTDEQGGNTLPLARWYQWYRVEKLSEGHATLTPPADGCSIGPDTLPQGATVISAADFFQLLELFRSSQAAR
jgi:hypothetical protein